MIEALTARENDEVVKNEVKQEADGLKRQLTKAADEMKLTKMDTKKETL